MAGRVNAKLCGLADSWLVAGAAKWRKSEPLGLTMDNLHFVVSSSPPPHRCHTGRLSGEGPQPPALMQGMYCYPRYSGLPPEHILLANRITGFLALNDPNMDIRTQDVLENWRQFHQAALSNNLNPIAVANFQTIISQELVTGTGGSLKKNTTRENAGTLKAWLYQHRENPYPSKGEKILLAVLTRMTLTQVSTWFANARRRLKKEQRGGGTEDCCVSTSPAPSKRPSSSSPPPLARKSVRIWSVADILSDTENSSTKADNKLSENSLD